jgi:hypothetical protein
MPNTETTTPAIQHSAIDKLREELGDIELTVLTGYTLADAMREGCSVTSQLTHGYVQGNNACALGAAVIAATARGLA